MHHTKRMKHFNYGVAIVALTLMLLVAGAAAAQTPPLTPPPQPLTPPPQPLPVPPPLPQPPGSLMRDGVAPPDPAVSATLPRYLASRSASFVDWLLDGSMLITTRFGEVEQIHQLRAPLAMREQLTYAPGGVVTGTARPYASDALVYLAPLRGGDSSQLVLQRLGTHELTALTDGSHREQRPLWAHDGKRIAFASNRRNGVDVDVYVLDTTDAGATPQLVVGGAGNRWRVFDWSIDDKRLLLGRDAPPDSELYVAQVEGGELTAVGFSGNGADRMAARTGSGKPAPRATAATAVPVHDARFATDGRGVLVLSHFAAPGAVPTGAGLTGAPFQGLAYIDLGGHDWRALSTDDHHDVECFDRSVDGRYIAYSVNDAGSSHLVLIDQQRKLDLTVATLPPGVISNLGFDASGKRLALTLESIRSPRDVYVLEPETQVLTRWTQSEAGPLDTQAFVAPQLLHYPTWDRVEGQPRMLTALVYRPLLAQAAPRAVLLLLCGGGGGQCRPGFDPFLQWLVNQLGVVVIAPNVRGSAGFGRALAAAGEGTLRDDAARDIGSLLVWIDLQRDLDRNRVALLGEGFGAYVALQSLADYGDRLRGAVVAFPPPLAGLANGAAIRRPVLLVQGLDNPGVPAYALEQLRARLRVDGVEAQYLAAAGEGARFTRRATEDAYRDAAGNFLAQLLR
jgi:dipeptidyl aminopeptidase/acylaminoacyl peptidase